MTGQSDDSNIEMTQNKVYGVPLTTAGTIQETDCGNNEQGEGSYECMS